MNTNPYGVIFTYSFDSGAIKKLLTLLDSLLKKK